MKAALLLLALVAGTAQADEWTGTDKALHLAAGAAISATSLTFTTPRNAFLIGAGVGLAKEVADYRSRARGGSHDPSAKDFAVTALGAAFGAYAPGVVLGRRSISYQWSF